MIRDGLEQLTEKLKEMLREKLESVLPFLVVDKERATLTEINHPSQFRFAPCRCTYSF